MLSGRPTLVTDAGETEMGPGLCSGFAAGGTAHQLVNRTDAVIKFLAISTHGDPDVVLYPDSNKVGAAERLSQGGGLRAFFRLDDAVDYFDGEQPPTD